MKACYGSDCKGDSFASSRMLVQCLFATSVILLGILVPQSVLANTAVSGKCVASTIPREWFPPLNSEHGLLDYETGEPPGWGACFRYSRATCCDKNQTDAVFRMVLMMERSGVSKTCQAVTEAALCAIGCDPDVGLGIIPAIMCSDQCDRWFHACENDFFSPSAGSIQKLPTPCSENAVVCFRLGDVYHNGHELCDAMAIRWSQDHSQCVSSEVDGSRRGQPIPKGPARMSSSTPSFVDLFVRDLRRLNAFAQKSIKRYMRVVDSTVGSNVWTVLGTLIAVSFGVFVYRKRQKLHMNDDFRGT